MKQINITFLLLLTLFVNSSCDYVKLRMISSDLENARCKSAKNRILNELRKEKHQDAYEYNLIYGFLCDSETENAFRQMDYILEKEESGLKFQTYFLKAYFLGELGETEKALENYQEALAFEPNSKEIKQNIELLLQQSKGGKGDKNKNKKSKSDNKNENQNSKSQGDNDPNSQPKDKIDESEQQKESQKKKNLSEKQIESLMKEIDAEEKKVRSQGVEMKKGEGSQNSDKNW